MARYHPNGDRTPTIVALIVTLLVALSVLAYPTASRLYDRLDAGGESEGYTWYVMDNLSTPSQMYELETAPKWRDGTIHLQHKGNDIWISGGWSAYKLKNK
jgi:hypothetical protein